MASIAEHDAEPIVSEALVRAVEALVMAAQDGVTRERLAELLDHDFGTLPEDSVDCALAALVARYADSAVELVQRADGWQFQVRSDYSRVVAGLWEQKPPKPSRAMLETLALICYRQPITRADIEAVRGVTVSSQLLRTLEGYEWIRVVGHRELPGRPALYATTMRFLADHGLSSLDELPALPELADPQALDAAFAGLTSTTDPGDETPAQTSPPDEKM